MANAIFSSLPTTIFEEMSGLARTTGAVNLGQGFPDFAAPDFVKQAAAAAVHADLNQYAPMPGLPHLRQAVAAQWQREYGRAVVGYRGVRQFVSHLDSFR